MYWRISNCSSWVRWPARVPSSSRAWLASCCRVPCRLPRWPDSWRRSRDRLEMPFSASFSWSATSARDSSAVATSLRRLSMRPCSSFRSALLLSAWCSGLATALAATPAAAAAVALRGVLAALAGVLPGAVLMVGLAAVLAVDLGGAAVFFVEAFSTTTLAGVLPEGGGLAVPVAPRTAGWCRIRQPSKASRRGRNGQTGRGDGVGRERGARLTRASPGKSGGRRPSGGAAAVRSCTWGGGQILGAEVEVFGPLLQRRLMWIKSSRYSVG